MASNSSLGLLESARRWVLANLPYDRNDSGLAAYLNGLDTNQLLIIFHNWSHRLIKPQPRAVHRSAAFLANPETSARAADLALLLDDIEQGRDLRKYLSRDVERSPVALPSGRRPDLDLMLNDWGVHHLHTSSTVEADGFVKRDGPLLFVSFMPEDAYVIDVMQHKDWARNHVLEVLASEWPDAGVIDRIPGALPTGQSLTDEQRANLRANAYNASFEHGGSVFMPAGGMVAGKTTLAATLATQRLVRQLEAIEKNYAEDPRTLAADFARCKLSLPQQPSFEFEIREHGAGLFETQTSAWIAL